MLMLLKVNASADDAHAAHFFTSSHIPRNVVVNPIPNRHKIGNCVMFTAYYITCTSKAKFVCFCFCLRAAATAAVCCHSIFAANFFSLPMLSLISVECFETLTRHTMASSRVYANIVVLLEFLFVSMCAGIFSYALKLD